jgi:hypothetical protein
MFNLLDPPCVKTEFSENGMTQEGVKGWWSDDLSPGKRTICFLGTSVPSHQDLPLYGYADLVADLFAFPLRPDWCHHYRLHGGFLSYEERAWTMIQSVLTVDKPIIIIGHSMGAAIAAILALHAIHSIPNFRSDCHLFALPTCIGNQVFKDDFESCHPETQDFCVGWDPMRYMQVVVKFLLIFLGSPVPINHVNIEHAYKFDIRHPINSVKTLVGLMLADHCAACIQKHIPDYREQEKKNA